MVAEIRREGDTLLCQVNDRLYHQCHQCNNPAGNNTKICTVISLTYIEIKDGTEDGCIDDSLADKRPS